MHPRSGQAVSFSFKWIRRCKEGGDASIRCGIGKEMLTEI